MDVAFPPARQVRAWILGLVSALLCLRLAHVHLLWADEDYHLAAAIQMLHGKLPYRDFWYDKPPLSAFYYLLVGGYAGWPLRILDAGYVALACWLTFWLARGWWAEAEGWCAAVLLGFFTAFYLPSAVIPFAADALMLAPHLAAMVCAREGRPWWAGVWAGVAFLANAKALFVLLCCFVWLPAELALLIGGFAVPTLSAALLGVATGAWHGYVEQVWRWGFIYAANSPVTHPFSTGVVRTSHWLGFHAALAVGAVFGWLRVSGRDRWRFGVWLALSFAAVCLGSRFAPHYFLQLLPALITLASRGAVAAWQEQRRLLLGAMLILLLVPGVRFGPRYVSLAYDNAVGREPHWLDVGLDLDSQDAARRINAAGHPGDTLFVWGYRPDLYVFTRLAAPGRFWDSQPLTGVPADRHLSATTSIYAGAATAANRRELIQTQPTWIVDGLGLLNPKLAPTIYPELQSWLAGYELVGRTKLSLIYRKK